MTALSDILSRFTKRASKHQRIPAGTVPGTANPKHVTKPMLYWSRPVGNTPKSVIKRAKRKGKGH